MQTELLSVLLFFSDYDFYISTDHSIPIYLIQILSMIFHFCFPNYQHEHEQFIYELTIWPFTLFSLMWLIFFTTVYYLYRLT